MATPAWISLGSNLGDRKGTLDAALAALAETPGVALRAVSTYHETAPIGGPAGQGAFLNAAAHLETTLAPLDLLDALQSIEWKFGRIRTVRWGERTLDLDILIYGYTFLETHRLKLPHLRLGLRRFVLTPLAEIAPDVMYLRSKLTAAELLANLDRRPRMIALHGPSDRRTELVFRGLVEALHGIPSELEASDPEPLLDDEVLRDFLDSIDRNFDSLRPERFEIAALADSWIVADHDRNHDLTRMLRSWFTGDASKNPIGRDKWRRAMGQTRRLESGSVVEATFVVVLHDPETLLRGPYRGAPQLRPESTQPEAIIAEVLATCRGIEGG